MNGEGARWVALGRVKGAFGVRGELRVVPELLPIARILPDATPFAGFSPATLLELPLWRLGREPPGALEVETLAGRWHGDQILTRLKGIDNREALQALAGMWIWVDRALLPDPGKERYYWFRLLGMRVVDETDPAIPPRELGRVDGLFATGSNDVLVVNEGEDEERLIPFIRDTILGVEPEQELIRVRLMDGL